MIINLSLWNYGLIFALLCVVMGIATVMTLRRTEQRRLAGGLFLQGVMLIFVVGAARFQSAADPNPNPAKSVRNADNDRRGLDQGSVDLRMAGLAIAGLLIVQTLIGPVLPVAEQSDEDLSS